MGRGREQALNPSNGNNERKRLGAMSKAARFFSSKGWKPVAKVGRNEPCPCGSGRKYKKCHGAVQQALLRQG